MKTNNDDITVAILFIGLALGFWLGIFVPYDVQEWIRKVVSVILFTALSIGACCLFLRGVVILIWKGLRKAGWIASPLILLSCLPLHAADVPLEWDAPPEPVKSYLVVEKLPVGNPVLMTVAAPATKAKLLNVPPGPHTYYVFAVTADGLASDNSNELTVTVPGAPKNLRVGPPVVALEYSTDLSEWNTLAFVALPDDPRGQIRARLTIP